MCTSCMDCSDININLCMKKPNHLLDWFLNDLPCTHSLRICDRYHHTEHELQVKHNFNSSMDFTKIHVNLIGFFYGLVKVKFSSRHLRQRQQRCSCVVAWGEKERLDFADVCLFICSNRSALFLFHFSNLPILFCFTPKPNAMTQIHVVKTNTRSAE